jgi:hypothetical protein
MLDAVGLSKEWWVEAIFDSLSCPKQSSYERQRNHTIRGMGKEKNNFFLFAYLVLFG